jgi:hypothetical protein
MKRPAYIAGRVVAWLIAAPVFVCFLLRGGR